VMRQEQHALTETSGAGPFLARPGDRCLHALSVTGARAFDGITRLVFSSTSIATGPWQVAAGLIYGQVKKSYRRRKLVQVTPVMRLGTHAVLKVAGPRTGPFWTTEHRFHRAGESDCPSRSGGSGTSNLGHFPAGLTSPGSPRVVASLLSFCASSRITTSGARAATRARWQAGGATLPTVYLSDGSRENEPTMDRTRGALLPIAAGFRLRATQARCGCNVMSCAGR